jgi:hypothetical protein
VRGISALPATGLDQPQLGQSGQQHIQQRLFQPVVDQPLPESGQHRVIKPRIGQLQTERVFPVDPGPHRISGLPISQVLKRTATP